MRCFVAVNLPGEIREEVGKFTASLKEIEGGVRWVRPENIHLTLKFLGNVDQDTLQELCAALDGALAGHLSFSLTVKGAGVFPPRGRPREKRPFTPHLTVGRARDPRRSGSLGPAIAANPEREWGQCVVDRVHLMRSELFPTGPRYSILREVRLAVGKKD
jgi:2'-5' RNA ligase